MKKDTLKSISQRTGYSMTTVSRVLNGNANKYRISKKTTEIITAEARESNFTPSLLAKGLRTNKTRTIGLLVPGIDNPYFANIASIVISEAKKAGNTVVLVDSMESEESEREELSSLVSRQVDGVIAVPCGQNPSYLENIDRGGTPVVLIDRYYDNTTLSYVCTDNYRGGYEATSYLLQNGHANILCIRGVPHSTPSCERARGYADAMQAHGCANEGGIEGSDFSVRNGYLETKLALQRSKPPTAIFAMSNTILLGALKAIREASLQIPSDISIISFDNNVYLDYLDPAITRISQPINEIGAMAIKLLMQRIAGDGDMQQARLQLPPQLVVCNSVARVRQAEEAYGNQ